MVVYDDLSKLCNSEELTMHHLSSESARFAGQTWWLFRFALSSADRSPGAISCFVVFVSRSFLHGWRPNDTLFERIEFRYVLFLLFYGFCITFENGGGSWESFLPMTCYDRDNKFIVKINFTLHNFFHLVVEYNKYTYRRDITMSLTLETSDNRRERH